MAMILRSPTFWWGAIQWHRSLLGGIEVKAAMEEREKAIWAIHLDSLPSNMTIRPTHPLTITHVSDLHLFDSSRPAIFRGLSKDTVLSSANMITDPDIKDIIVDYFADARLVSTVPDSVGPVGEVVRKIIGGGPQKFGTQKIVSSAPFIIDRLVKANDWLPLAFNRWRIALWRGVGQSDTVLSYLANLIVTVPVFMATGQPNKGLKETTRTDLHCEPIANLVFQTQGEKVWTLVEPQHSQYLKPTLAPDGRAYFYSSLDPLSSTSLDHVPRYEVKTQAGDIMYVPTWTWHRVEYLPGITAISVSLFEFNTYEFMVNNPLFAVTLFPNIIKELLGFKFT